MKCVARAPRVLWLACVLGVLWLSACAGCQREPDGPVVSCPEVPCGALEECVQGVCVGLSDVVCFPRCGDDEVCQAGECIPGVETCEQAGQTCDVLNPFSGEFFCIDWDGLAVGRPATCSNACDANGACPTGEVCRYLSDPRSTMCGVDSDCPNDMVCRDGSCFVAACQPSECEGFLSGASTCQELHSANADYPDGAQCIELPDETRFCFPAGPRDVGEACVGFVEGYTSGRLTETCAPALGCVQGSCQRGCSLDSDCEGEQVCLFEDEGVIATGVGFCGLPCPAFSAGACGEQGKCLPVDGVDGYCVPAGEADAFEVCEPNAWQCVEGTTCVDLGGDGSQARCMPMCNVTIAPLDPSQPVSVTDQQQRDATCPQPEETVRAFVRLFHFAEDLGAVDLYLDRGAEPWIASLAPGGPYDGSTANQTYIELLPGAHTVGVLPAGASVLDAPLAELTFAIARDSARDVVLSPASPSSADVVELGVLPERGEALVIANLIPDVDAIDVQVFDVGGEQPVAQLFGVRFGATGAVELGDRATVDVSVTRAGVTEQVLLERRTVGITATPSWFLSGTQELDDGYAVTLVTDDARALPARMEVEPRMICNELGERAFGYCQQFCQGAQDYGADVCDGAGMGCYPRRLSGLGGYQSLCQPAGQVAVGERCDPASTFSECEPGAYCLEFGNGDSDVADGEARGRCEPLCVVDEPDHMILACRQGQVCQALDPDSFDVGRCGFSCEPDASYAGATCPLGLMSCKPAARLVDDTSSTGDAAAIVVQLEEVCSASGVLTEGQPCSGADCEPGTECMFPRSIQADLVSTLLSPYFGAAGVTPTCRAQCDPFDGRSSQSRCGVGETCLVNFPWSADVGHCAPIVEDVMPFAGCTRPGESCGEDAVCVVDGGAPFCLRLCEYTGGASSQAYDQSTCPASYQCAPLINDIGICR